MADAPLKQGWRCERCQTHGFVSATKHADVFSVLHKLEDAHRKASPTCRWNVDYVRVYSSAAAAGVSDG